MENENKYASKGVGGTALGLSIGALGAELLGGTFGNILGGARNGDSCDHTVNRYELGLQQEIAAKDTRIGLLESNIYTDSKIADTYERLNTRINGIEAQICQQNVYNATNTAAIGCINNQIAQLMSLTKFVIPNSSICPGWTTTTTTGA